MRPMPHLMLALALGLTLIPRAACADENAPTAALAASPTDRLLDVSSTRSGLPPLSPRHNGLEAHRAWRAAAAHAAGANDDATLTGDIWLSLAEHARTSRRDAPEARIGYERALAAYPPSAPFAHLARMRLGDLAVIEGDVPTAQQVLAALDAQPPLQHPTPRMTNAHRLRTPVVASLWRVTRPRLAAFVAQAHGRHHEGAGIWQTYAEQRGVPDVARARAYRSAALAFARAGRKLEALTAIDRALALPVNAEERAPWQLWRLAAAHDGLDRAGEVSLDSLWRGSLHVDDAVAYLRRWGDHHAMATHALTLASGAVRAERLAVADALFDEAFDNPALLARALDEPRVLGGLLVGVSVALDNAGLGSASSEGASSESASLDRARRRLRQIERLQAGPSTTVDALRVRLSTEARDAIEASTNERGMSDGRHEGATEAQAPASIQNTPARIVPEAAAQNARPDPVGPQTGASEQVPVRAIALGVVLLLWLLLTARTRKARAHKTRSHETRAHGS